MDQVKEKKIKGEVLMVNVTALNPAKYNPRKIGKKNLERLRKSMETLDYFEPIIVNKDMTVISGHQRLKVLIADGYQLAEVIQVDVDKVTEKKMNLAANSPGLQGEWDKDKLALLFGDLELSDTQLDTLGFSKSEVDRLLMNSNPLGPDPNVDLLVTGTKTGDRIQLGRHTLLCGDATDHDQVSALMDGVDADLFLCDPPYNLGIDYDDYDDAQAREDYEEFSSKWFGSAMAVSKRGGFITPGVQNLSMWMHLVEPTWVASWVRHNGTTGGKISNLNLWEPILVLGDHDRDSRANDIYEYNVSQQKHVGDHPCPKPLKLIQDILQHYAHPHEVVVDLFGGTGTTLAAAEQLGLSCYILEKSPHYCDIIRSRFKVITEGAP